jgi:uncharacterized membrane protein
VCRDNRMATIGGGPSRAPVHEVIMHDSKLGRNNVRRGFISKLLLIIYAIACILIKYFKIL